MGALFQNIILTLAGWNVISIAENEFGIQPIKTILVTSGRLTFMAITIGNGKLALERGGILPGWILKGLLIVIDM